MEESASVRVSETGGRSLGKRMLVPTLSVLVSASVMISLAVWSAPMVRVANVVVLTDTILIKFVLIPPGSFMMGADDTDDDALDDERPQARVTLSQPFYLSQTEITQRQFQAIMGSNPSFFQGKTASWRRPVENVSFLDAIAFCNALSKREKIAPYYKVDRLNVSILGGNGFRLPTEAEWEYAARGGTTERYLSGTDPEQLTRFAYFGAEDDDGPIPVGLKAENPFGLKDMFGNVWEWCWDFKDNQFYKTRSLSLDPAHPIIDPTGPPRGENRVLRGGSYVNPALHLRASCRYGEAPTDRHKTYGFRIARSAD